MSETDTRRLSVFDSPLLSITLSAALLATPAGATAVGSASGTLHLEVFEFQDAEGSPIGTLPAAHQLAVERLAARHCDTKHPPAFQATSHLSQDGLLGTAEN
ncbi:MAG: hypothetical protein ACE5GX_02785 [Thermoanaerobaculia bacterium]